MGHQESDVWPFSSFAECLPSRIGARTKASGQYSRDSVPVSGGRRTFGVPLEQLVIAGHSGVPRVVVRLCHFIERHGMQTETLFRTPGNQRSVAKMRADFDMYGDSNLERYKDVAAAAGCLKMFLRELPEAVVPAGLTADFVATLHGDCSLTRHCEKLSTLVHTLPPPHYALLRYLCSFLRRVTNFHCAAHMSPETLGIVFGPNVFRVPAASEASAPSLHQQAAINRLLGQLIMYYDRKNNKEPPVIRTYRDTGITAMTFCCRENGQCGSTCHNPAQSCDPRLQSPVTPPPRSDHTSSAPQSVWFTGQLLRCKLLRCCYICSHC